SVHVGDQWLYEPKLDGVRGLLRHGTSGDVQVLSRNLRDLAPSFPELGQAACSLPAGTLLDGEIVIADESGNADFGALQQRLTVADRKQHEPGQEIDAPPAHNAHQRVQQ